MCKANYFTRWGSELVALAALVFTVSAYAADWTYDSGAGTISDDVWTFTASVASGNKMTVKTCTGCPSELSTLDFSKPVTDANDTVYTIVALGVDVTGNSGTSLFGKTTQGWKDCVMVNGENLAELILPTEGLKYIYSGSFCGCTALTNIVNFLPDSVTTIGNAAFQKVPAKCDLYALGVSNGFGRNCFKGSGVRSVHFGKNIKTIGNGSNSQGAFEGCNYITNIVFHPEGSGITIKKATFAMSYISTSMQGAYLTSPLVLYGVTTIENDSFARIFLAGSDKSVTFDNGLQSINTNTIKSVNNFTKVHFLGAPPTTLGTKFADYGKSTSTQIATYIPYKYRQQWWQYAAGYDPEMSDAEKEQLIKREGTTFSSTYATTTSKRPLLLADMPPGLVIIVH